MGRRNISERRPVLRSASACRGGRRLISSKEKETTVRYITTMALMVNLGVAGLYAHERHVKMTFSGTAGPSSVDLQIPDRTTGGDNFTGNGTLGAFTFREVESNGGSPEPSSTCSGPYFTLTIGAGVLSFQDGSSARTGGVPFLLLLTTR